MTVPGSPPTIRPAHRQDDHRYQNAVGRRCISPIEDFDNRYLLGVHAMDLTHRQFADLVNRLAATSKPGFIALYPELVSHTFEHFSSEDLLMLQCGFPAIAEHRSEHARVLGELERFAAQVEGGRTRLARAYIVDQLPRWFDLHAATMDSALAAHLNGSVAVTMPIERRVRV